MVSISRASDESIERYNFLCLLEPTASGSRCKVVQEARKRFGGSGLNIHRVHRLAVYVGQTVVMIGRYTWKTVVGSVQLYGLYMRYAEARKKSKLFNQSYITYMTGSRLHFKIF